MPAIQESQNYWFFFGFFGFWFLSGKGKCWRRVSELLFFFEISQVAQAGKSTQRAETVMIAEEWGTPGKTALPGAPVLYRYY